MENLFFFSFFMIISEDQHYRIDLMNMTSKALEVWKCIYTNVVVIDLIRQADGSLTDLDHTFIKWVQRSWNDLLEL